jgi:hypothetical protein
VQRWSTITEAQDFFEAASQLVQTFSRDPVSDCVPTHF